ncbi:MAG: hypothetical protein UT11_C0001G0008 [Berkelbacteria bacterium GW2011_GWA2_38_9]|uniref:Uncharacterized protein n=1 Tax=Berkelbacteria bacterium GW2011_GWA2_38_9 TaxID=1618334 RepID=A0A0G0LFM0_9BACT|nr:MAG: hypothetical protein UT11_C0001G0008 [Berkelbacteria bacterium GW2011_GWA2_38_9]
MKLKKTNKWKNIAIILIIIIISVVGAVYVSRFKSDKNTSKSKIESLNKNLGPELEKIPNNTVIIMNIKDSFTLPQGYRFDSQIVDKSILIYPQDQQNIEYSGLQSLESLKGIFVTSANVVKDEEQFKKTNQDKFDIYKKVNPKSDAESQIIKDGKGNNIFKVTQTKPFKIVETVLNKEYLIEIVSYAQTPAYQDVIKSYNASELISESDHKAIVKLHKYLVESYLENDGKKLFSLLSTEAQKNNPIEKIKKSVELNVFKDMISLEPTALYYFNGNFVLQSKVIFNENMMSRIDISLSVNYDDKTNNWLIDSYSIKNKEKYLSAVEIK